MINWEHGSNISHIDVYLQKEMGVLQIFPPFVGPLPPNLESAVGGVCPWEWLICQRFSMFIVDIFSVAMSFENVVYDARFSSKENNIEFYLKTAENSYKITSKHLFWLSLRPKID